MFIFIPLPFAILFIVKFRKTMNRRNIRAWVLGMRTNHHLQDILNGIRIVKSYGNEDAAVNTFQTNTANQAKQDCSNAKLFDTVFPIMGFVIRLGSYAILMYGNYLMFVDPMTVGLVNQCNTYCNMIYEPIMQITTIPRSISEFTTSLSKVLEILEENPDVSDIDSPKYVKLSGDISLRNVTFGYNSYDPVLEHVTFDIKASFYYYLHDKYNILFNILRNYIQFAIIFIPYPTNYKSTYARSKTIDIFNSTRDKNYQSL